MPRSAPPRPAPSYPAPHAPRSARRPPPPTPPPPPRTVPADARRLGEPGRPPPLCGPAHLDHLLAALPLALHLPPLERHRAPVDGERDQHHFCRAALPLPLEYRLGARRRALRRLPELGGEPAAAAAAAQPASGGLGAAAATHSPPPLLLPSQVTPVNLVGPVVSYVTLDLSGLFYSLWSPNSAVVEGDMKLILTPSKDALWAMNELVSDSFPINYGANATAFQVSEECEERAGGIGWLAPLRGRGGGGRERGSCARQQLSSLARSRRRRRRRRRRFCRRATRVSTLRWAFRAQARRGLRRAPPQARCRVRSQAPPRCRARCRNR